MFYLLLLLFALVALGLRVHSNMCKKRKSLYERHVCIVGGSSGIGKSLAILCAREGAHVTIIARNKEKLLETVKVLEGNRRDDRQVFKSVSLNCIDYTIVDDIMNSIDSERPIYMFVNCAGMALCGRFEEMSIESIKLLVNINLFATFYPLKVVIPKLKERRQGIVVLTGSQASLFGIYGLSVYSATKYAIRGLAEALHMELQDYNVNVTLCLPPDTDTPGYENENVHKPDETRMISNSAGLFKPEEVAKKMLDDALEGKFFSIIGFESWILTTLCVGMAPFKHVYEVFVQTLILGPLRLVSCFYLKSFQKLITNEYEKREEKKRRGIYY